MASRYWEEREQANKRRYNRADKEAQKEVREIHKRMQDEIQKDIDAFFGKYAADEGISLAEAKRRVSKLDIEAFERKAKKYVEDRDFSEQANAEMKLYNLTMKVNRLELLKAEIGLEMIKAHDDINGLTDRVLLERAEEEYRRQAGILGDTVQDIAGRARRLADASFHNATWKDRAWTNHAELKANLDVLLQRGLIRGDNPRQLARSLRKSLGVDLNKCERLMVTELARVQIDASIDSFKQNGFEQYQYITCGYGDACENCKALSDKVFKIKDMQVGENAPPMHPWCHCSIAPYEDSEEYDAWLDFLEQGGTTAEWNALTDEEKERIKSRRATQSEKPRRMAANKGDWDDTEPRILSKEEKKDLINYAKKKGVRIHGINNFDGDPELLKMQIDVIPTFKSTFWRVFNFKPITIQFSKKFNDEIYASTWKKTITYNTKALRNKSITEENLRKSGKFSACDFQAITRHEMGHVIESVYGEKGLDFAYKAYYNVRGKRLDFDGLYDFLVKNISEYAFPAVADEITGEINLSDHEITSEILNCGVKDEFTKEFIKLWKEDAQR